MSSYIEKLASLPGTVRAQILTELREELGEETSAGLTFCWNLHARFNQLPPEGSWRVWLIRTGRGWGKTRTGAEWIRAEIESGKRKRLGLIARTAADVRDVMVEGESGILNISPPWFRPIYEPSKRRLTWPNGAIATTYSADEPDHLRGPQHDGVWADELASWRRPEAWDMAMFGLRLGTDPRAVVTTTPRPVPVIRELIDLSSTVETIGSSFDNRANLSEQFFDRIILRYKDTRLGRQEIYAEILEDVEGALWTSALLEETRVSVAPELSRIVVGVDPAVTSKEDSNETGIIVVGVSYEKLLGREHYFVLEDRSLRSTPLHWAAQAIAAYDKWDADRVIGEVNNGGDLVEQNIRLVDDNVSYKDVRASRGKLTRAEPAASLYEQDRVHHVGCFPKLEDQLTTWVQGDPSPDRLDALVWALKELAGEGASWYVVPK